MEHDDLKKKKEDLTKKFTSQPIELVPFYHDLKNEIVDPKKIVVETQYFMDKWTPLLGPALTVLVIRLRRYCYYNKTTKEKRDWCYPDQYKLAKEIGISVDTLQRELKRDIAKQFIQRKPRYVYNETLGKKVRASDIYYISLDDPLLPEDCDKLILMSLDRQLSQELENKDPKYADPPKPQNAVQVGDKPVDNSSPKPQNAVYIYEPQNAVANVNNNTNNSTNNVNVGQSPNFNVNDPLVEDMVSYLGDKKSVKFYYKIARTCPAPLVYRALGETKEAALDKKIKTTKGAYFTDLIKRLAKEQKINLSIKTKQNTQ